MNEPSTFSLPIESKDVITVLPILWGVFALLFDVGYFWGVEINFFNFFSFTEHLVFAAEAAPYALVALFLISVSFVVGIIGRAKLTARRARSKPRHKWVKASAYLLYFGANVAIVFYFFYAGYFRYGLFSSFALIWLVLLFWADSFRLYTLCLGMSLVSLFAFGSLLFGHYNGTEYLNLNQYDYVLVLKDGSKLPIKLFRSGDRGVLVQRKEDRSLVFYSRDRIAEISEQIVAAPTSTTPRPARHSK